MGYNEWTVLARVTFSASRGAASPKARCRIRPSNRRGDRATMVAGNIPGRTQTMSSRLRGGARRDDARAKSW